MAAPWDGPGTPGMAPPGPKSYSSVTKDTQGRVVPLLSVSYDTIGEGKFMSTKAPPALPSYVTMDHNARTGPLIPSVRGFMYYSISPNGLPASHPTNRRWASQFTTALATKLGTPSAEYPCIAHPVTLHGTGRSPRWSATLLIFSKPLPVEVFSASQPTLLSTGPSKYCLVPAVSPADQEYHLKLRVGLAGAQDYASTTASIEVTIGRQLGPVVEIFHPNSGAGHGGYSPYLEVTIRVKRAEIPLLEDKLTGVSVLELPDGTRCPIDLSYCSDCGHKGHSRNRCQRCPIDKQWKADYFAHRSTCASCRLPRPAPAPVPVTSPKLHASAPVADMSASTDKPDDYPNPVADVSKDSDPVAAEGGVASLPPTPVALQLPLPVPWAADPTVLTTGTSPKAPKITDVPPVSVVAGADPALHEATAARGPEGLPDVDLDVSGHEDARSDDYDMSGPEDGPSDYFDMSGNLSERDGDGHREPRSPRSEPDDEASQIAPANGLLALTTPQARSIGARLSGRRGRSRGGAVTKRFRPLPSDAPLVSAVDRNE